MQFMTRMNDYTRTVDQIINTHFLFCNFFFFLISCAFDFLPKAPVFMLAIINSMVLFYLVIFRQ